MPLVVSDTPNTPATSAPQQSATVAPSQVVARPDLGAYSSNQGSKGNTPLSFRALLDPTTVGSLAATGQTPSWTSTAPVAAGQNDSEQSILSGFSPDRMPTAAPPELTASESAGLLSAAQTVQPFDQTKPRPYVGATSRYAQAYFADTRTFARRGESLEIKA